MSRLWQRSQVAVLCGRCGEQVQAGEPVQQVSLLGLRRPLWRCQNCAGEAPPDLPAQIERSRTTKAMTPLRKLKMPADIKMRQAGDK